MSLEQLFAGRGISVEETIRNLKRVADQHGLPFGNRTMTYNSRRAQELGKWAEFQGQGDAFHWKLFKAYFADGLNIGAIPVLLELVDSLGLDPGAARRVLLEGDYRKEVDKDWAYSRAAGITAVPTFVAGGSSVVGAQPYPVLERLAVSAGFDPL